MGVVNGFFSSQQFVPCRLKQLPASCGRRLSGAQRHVGFQPSRSASGGSAPSRSAALSNGSSRSDKARARCAATANMPVQRWPAAWTGGQQLRVCGLAFPACRICRRFARHMVRARPRCAVPANRADKSRVDSRLGALPQRQASPPAPRCGESPSAAGRRSCRAGRHWWRLLVQEARRAGPKRLLWGTRPTQPNASKVPPQRQRGSGRHNRLSSSTRMQFEGMRNSGAVGSTAKAREPPGPAWDSSSAREAWSRSERRLSHAAASKQAVAARCHPRRGSPIPRAVPRKHLAQCNQLAAPTGRPQPGEVTPPQRLGAGHGG